MLTLTFKIPPQPNDLEHCGLDRHATKHFKNIYVEWGWSLSPSF